MVRVQPGELPPAWACGNGLKPWVRCAAEAAKEQVVPDRCRIGISPFPTTRPMVRRPYAEITRQTPPRNGHARGVRWKRGPTPAPVAARGFSPSSPSAGGPEQVHACFLRDPRCICAARGKGRDGSGEQKAECVKGEERCEYQECVGGCLRLSATDFALRVLHERDDAFAEHAGRGSTGSRRARSRA